MNDATREMIERAKAKRAADAIAEKERQQAKADKRRATELRRIQAQEYARQREREAKRQRSALDSNVIPEPDQQRRKTLPPDKLAQVGARIEGSKLFRDFCNGCGEAIRVVNPGIPNICLDCRPTGCPGHSSGGPTTGNIEYHGGRFHSGEW